MDHQLRESMSRGKVRALVEARCFQTYPPRAAETRAAATRDHA
jgi:hypothetical protein